MENSGWSGKLQPRQQFGLTLKQVNFKSYIVSYLKIKVLSVSLFVHYPSWLRGLLRLLDCQTTPSKDIHLGKSSEMANHITDSKLLFRYNMPTPEIIRLYKHSKYVKYVDIRKSFLGKRRVFIQLQLAGDQNACIQKSSCEATVPSSTTKYETQCIQNSSCEVTVSSSVNINFLSEKPHMTTSSM
jgi:hypothetical protein